MMELFTVFEVHSEELSLLYMYVVVGMRVIIRVRGILQFYLRLRRLIFGL